MKNITIAGTVGRDSVVRRTQAGDPILNFSVATDDGYGDKKRTIWFDVTGFGTRWERLEQYITKGTRVAVAGDLSTREHEGKTYITVRANEITLLGGGNQSSGGGSVSKPSEQNFDLSDEVPFLTKEGLF